MSAIYTPSETLSAIEELCDIFPAGSTAYVVQRHVSQSGMMRRLSVLSVQDGEIRNVTYLVARAMGRKLDRDPHFAIRVNGAGMDMHFALVYDLSRVLYSDGYALTHRTI